MRLRSRPQSILLAVAIVGVSGCREELGPERFPTASVSGVILQSGRPATAGWVEFLPFDGAVGDFRSARIGPDGSFHADRVAVGLNVVQVVALPGLPPGASGLLAHDSPIRRTIPAEPAGPIKIDVIEELLRHQAAEADKAKVQADHRAEELQR